MGAGTRTFRHGYPPLSLSVRNAGMRRQRHRRHPTDRGRALHFRGLQLLPAGGSSAGHAVTSPDVLALAFHVRYWDSLGWPDRFALAFADQRQSRYARRLTFSSVFTPQLIVEGERSFIGSDQRGILPALQGEREPIAHFGYFERGYGASPPLADAARTERSDRAIQILPGPTSSGWAA